jgi:acyl carrier protein
MASVESRLSACLAAVFPLLSPPEIVGASMSSVAAWDSVATATLMALLEEEFGIQVAPEDLNRMVSYGEIAAYLRSKGFGD